MRVLGSHLPTADEYKRAEEYIKGTDTLSHLINYKNKAEISLS